MAIFPNENYNIDVFSQYFNPVTQMDDLYFSTYSKNWNKFHCTTGRMVDNAPSLPSLSSNGIRQQAGLDTHTDTFFVWQTFQRPFALFMDT